MEFRLLGPVELWARGEQVRLPSTKMKQLMAALAWEPGEIVSSLALVSRLWDEDAPPKEMVSLHSNVSRLRKCLEDCGDADLRVEHIDLGYRLTVPPECVDVHQFRRSVTLAKAAADQDKLEEAVRLLRAAESLVHGEPLAGLPGSWARGRRSVLEEEVHAATLLRVELQLAAHPEAARELLPELRGLAEKNEFDEPTLELRLRALESANRASEALQAYSVYRARLRETSGLSPGPSLQTLYARLLQAEPTRGKPARTTPTATPAVVARRPVAEPPDTLERDPIGFVGRSENEHAITAEIDSQLESGSSAICVINGMPAIGKSSLALHLAHRLRSRCPDGAIQLHLRGHDEFLRPTNTESALDVLLRMLGVDPGQIQHASGLDHSIALWRRHTAGKRLLLFLDDAADGEQILPLIPNGAGSIVLATARKRLTGLPDVIHHTLTPMADNEAAELFIRSARMSRTSDPALHDVVAACGGFPMALCVAGTALRFRSSWSIADLADDLASTRGAHQLDSILAPAVYRSVASSYRELPELQRKLLRRLSLNPGSRIHLSAATALAEASPFETHTALCNLVDQNLVAEPKRRYYELHDMIKLFAEHVLETEEDPEETAEAAGRLARFILGAANAATRLFFSHRHVFLGAGSNVEAGEGDHGFTTPQQATAWLDDEQAWLRTIAMHWYENGDELAAASLSHLLAAYLERKSLWKESIPLHEKGLIAWRRSGNQVAEAHALIDLAAVRWRLGAFQEALTNAKEGLDLWSSLGDTGGEADALLQMGRVYHSKHQHAEAIECLKRCAELRKHDREKAAYASSLHHLGAAQFDAGHYQQGIETIELALRLARIADDPPVERNCINSLGNFRLRLGDYAAAEVLYRQALSLSERFGDARRIAYFAQNLGESLVRQHRPEVALPLLERAFEIYKQRDDTQGLIETQAAQAHAEIDLDRRRHARVLIDSAALAAERLGDALTSARVYLVYGHIYNVLNDFKAAELAYRDSLGHARSANMPLMQALAYHQLGDLNQVTGDTDSARRYWQQSLDLYGHGLASPATDELRRKLGDSLPDSTAP